MTPLGWIIIAICILIGITLGPFIFRRFPNLLNKDEKKIKEVLNNPHLLVEKLKASGKVYDGGEVLDIKVGKDSETGQDVVIVEEIKSTKAKKIQKKIIKKVEKKIKVPDKVTLKNTEGKKITFKKRILKKTRSKKKNEIK